MDRRVMVALGYERSPIDETFDHQEPKHHCDRVDDKDR